MKRALLWLALLRWRFDLWADRFCKRKEPS
jgi:hypothetical protein